MKAWANFGWGHGGSVPSHFQAVEILCAISPLILLFRFCIWRDFKNKSDVCHILCEKLFMLAVTHTQWRAEGGANGATAPGIQGREHPESEIQKI